MILHWKIVFTSLNSSFHSNPNSRCFVLVHFQSHNAPNLPPLHISETDYGYMSTPTHNPKEVLRTVSHDFFLSKSQIVCYIGVGNLLLLIEVPIIYRD